MNKYDQIPEACFKRDVGVSLENFEAILTKVEESVTKTLEKHPIKRRGIKSSISVADQLLLCLYYLRHYATFSKLGDQFGIGESYANKLFHRICNILVEEFSVPNRKELLSKDLSIILIDVTEQPIERPIEHQKKYYSGKKNATPLKFN